MFGLKLERRFEMPAWIKVIIPVLIVAISFVVTIPLMIGVSNPFQVFYYLIIGPFTDWTDFTEVLVASLPLIFTGLAVTVAFKARFWNIGAEGQLYAGAVAAAWAGVAFNLPGFLLIPIIFFLSFLAGSFWCLVCRILRSKIDEAISTLLFNWVMLYLVGALLSGPWQDAATKWPKSPEIIGAAHLPILIPGSRVNIGLVLAIALVFIIAWALKNTKLGFEITILGANPKTARYAGMNERYLITVVSIISGGLAGLAGAVEVCGKHFHLIEEISPGFGYTGIIAATLGGLNPIGTFLAAFFLGILNVGGQIMHQVTQTPSPLVSVLQGVMLLVTVSMGVFSRYRIVRGGKTDE